MSPQFRTRSPTLDTTPIAKTDHGPSLEMIAREPLALGSAYSTNGASPASPSVSPFLSVKRSSSHFSLSFDSQLFPSMSSSGMRSGIAHASSNLLQLGPPVSRDGVAEGCEPRAKKAKLSRQTKSQVALIDLAEDVVSEALPSGASPRFDASSQTIQACHDPVRQLQNMAFPSLPRLPTTISSCSFPDNSIPTLSPSGPATEGGANADDQDSPSFGWFVFTDVDEGDVPNQNEPSAAGTFLPDSKTDLAFRISTAPSAENQELVVQQALAADTIDDVLGDLF